MGEFQRLLTTLMDPEGNQIELWEALMPFEKKSWLGQEPDSYLVRTNLRTGKLRKVTSRLAKGASVNNE